ncbi:MAG: CoB--CoM heterodisulfide reductase iron-sulfur subunit A family protein, partial [Dehalococcoidia bacterium]
QTELEHGVTVIASGASELKPDLHLYGKDSRVLTALELDQKLIENDAALKEKKTVLFIQCVGSRIEERPYCSKVCCTHSIKSALKLKELNPDMDVFILYRDMRSYGLREDLYRDARAKGIIFIRYDFEKGLNVGLENQDLRVTFTDTIIRRQMEITPDMVVLASAITPPKENPLAQQYKVTLNDDGFFMEAHVKLRPVDCATDGVFICGLAHAPKSIEEIITQAKAAASRASTILSKDTIMAEGIVSSVDEDICSSCGTCEAVCPYGAIAVNRKKGVAEVNEALCKGCGTCCSACPSGAAQQRGFTTEQISAMIRASLGV